VELGHEKKRPSPHRCFARHSKSKQVEFLRLVLWSIAPSGIKEWSASATVCLGVLLLCRKWKTDEQDNFWLRNSDESNRRNLLPKTRLQDSSIVPPVPDQTTLRYNPYTLIARHSFRRKWWYGAFCSPLCGRRDPASLRNFFFFWFYCSSLLMAHCRHPIGWLIMQQGEREKAVVNEQQQHHFHHLHCVNHPRTILRCWRLNNDRATGDGPKSRPTHHRPRRRRPCRTPLAAMV
jgi:hypothetical protein